MNYLNQIITTHLEESIATKQAVLEHLVPEIQKAATLLCNAIKSGHKLLVCGNGGSAADSQHFAAEFTCRYDKDRAPLPAISLTTDSSHLTATGNDYGYDYVFERGVNALGKPGDVLVGISTSGNSPNIIKAIQAAKQKGIYTIGLLGKGGGKMKDIPMDVQIIVPSQITAHIQEAHITIIHILCKLVDEAVRR